MKISEDFNFITYNQNSIFFPPHFQFYFMANVMGFFCAKLENIRGIAAMDIKNHLLFSFNDSVAGQKLWPFREDNGINNLGYYQFMLLLYSLNMAFSHH